MMRESKAPDNKRSAHPSELVWALATLSLILPFAAIGVGVVALWRIFHHIDGGYVLLPVAAGLFVLDIVIDLWIANPHTSATEDPDLNRRGTQYIGRVVPLFEAIETGRGRVRLGDTVWTVEGPELPQGTRVRIVGCDGAVLQVEEA